VGRARPRRGAFGLRGRIVGAVLVTAVATLAVAAVALLGPLEHSLRNAEETTLHSVLVKSHAVREFEQLPLSDLSSTTTHGLDPAQRALRAQQQSLGRRLGASVYVLGYPNAAGIGGPQLPKGIDDLIDGDTRDDVTRAFRSHASNYTLGTIDGTDYARAALWFTTPFSLASPSPREEGSSAEQLEWVIAVRKPIDEIPGAVQAVRTAFLTAALAGLALTLILGIPLSFRVVRRLRRLRQAALDLADGVPGAEVELDRGRDEVGDLARTFALMQQRLGQQEAARRAFVATASHELRTPLASLDGMLELLSEDLREPQVDLEDSRALLERARVQSRRLGRLAADLLDLSRIDAEVTLRSEPVELGELSRAVLAEFELGTAERLISSELAVGRGSVWALGDPGSVARILRILLDNAVRATPDGAEIKVELHGGDHVTLSVCDRGPGVPAGERAMIFERFQRGRDTGGRAGFGLGLAIGRELAERMGGTLALDDEYAPGAKFKLSLPAARAPDHDVLAVV
jgi:signal transduction histidine kinase